MIKAIIFDYGGVIGRDPSKFIFRAVSKRFGVEEDKIEREISKFVKKVQKDQIKESVFWKKLAKNLDRGIRKKFKNR